MTRIESGVIYTLLECQESDGQNFLAAIVPHSSNEICQPFFENAVTRLVRTQHKDNSFHGKRNIAKFTRSTIWGVQLKSGDN
jgi:hypothetical protein